jgi:hypothetical protein
MGKVKPVFNPWKIDFVLFHPHFLPHGLCIECKTQSTAGSVDEKYIFVEKSLLNVAQINGCSTLFYLEGGAARLCVLDYLYAAATADNMFQFATSANEFRDVLRGKSIQKRRLPSAAQQINLFG